MERSVSLYIYIWTQCKWYLNTSKEIVEPSYKQITNDQMGKRVHEVGQALRFLALGGKNTQAAEAKKHWMVDV